MSMDSFDWDPEKYLANQVKHGISFLEARYASIALTNNYNVTTLIS